MSPPLGAKAGGLGLGVETVINLRQDKMGVFKISPFSLSLFPALTGLSHPHSLPSLFRFIYFSHHPYLRPPSLHIIV